MLYSAQDISESQHNHVYVQFSIISLDDIKHILKIKFDHIALASSISSTSLYKKK